MLQIASTVDASSPIDPKALDFACAIARQCFVNEHVFASTDEEDAAAQQLRDKVTAALASGAPVSELWLAVVATYYPLGTLPGAGALMDTTWSDALSGVLTQELREPAEEAKLRATIPALTPIEDDVSRKVRQQYEENPYPRWAKADPPKKALRFDRYMRNKFPAATFRELGKDELDVLIAGCGTGQQAIEAAPALSGRPNAGDRSQPDKPCLCATQDPRNGHRRNIEYAQADILKLGAIGRTFDVIEFERRAASSRPIRLPAGACCCRCCDRAASWRSASTAKSRAPASSRRAASSRSAATARAPTRSAGAGRDLIAHDGGKAFPDAYASSDFFSTSDCRDLLFHVQEHRLTIPQIAGFLADNALDFIGFELEAAVASRYRALYPADTAMTDLASWDAFERQHPSTFSGMYQFWVQKRM